MLTATVSVVSPGMSTPTGTVTFYDGGIAMNAVPIALTGTTASLSMTYTSPGSHSFTAVYSGDTNENTSTSAARAVTVNPVSTKTAVTFVSTPVVVGQSLDLVATVSVVSPGVSTPTGTVTFYDGGTSGTLLGSLELTGATATLPWAFTSAGSHSITAVYSGDTNDKTSSGTGSLNVGKDSTTTTLTTSGTPSLLGQAVTFTATVAVQSPGASTPTGTMTFKDGSTVLASGVSVVNGVATFTTTTLPEGANSITAVYSGDSNEGASTAAVLKQTIQSATTVDLRSSNLSAAPGTVTLTATVGDVAPGTGTATGTVSFFDSAGLIGTVTLVNGVATWKPSASVLPAGTYVIYAVYNGDAAHQGSTSTTITQGIS